MVNNTMVGGIIGGTRPEVGATGMSALLERLRRDHVAARMRHDTVLSNLLGTVLGACDTLAKAGKQARILTEAEIVGIVKTTANKVNETIAALRSRPERADDLAKAEAELRYLGGYLPPQLSRERLVEIATERKAAGADMPQIMAHLKATYPGQYDAREAAEVAREVTQAS